MATQITLPKDAEGKEVPLDTETLYDEYGNKRYIAKFIYHLGCEGWTVEYDNGVERFVSLLYLTPPDSWKKLEEDLDRGADALNYEACAYFGKSEFDCSSCIADKGGTCEKVVMRDILTRIRKLRGEGHAD